MFTCILLARHDFQKQLARMPHIFKRTTNHYIEIYPLSTLPAYQVIVNDKLMKSGTNKHVCVLQLHNGMKNYVHFDTENVQREVI